MYSLHCWKLSLLCARKTCGENFRLHNFEIIALEKNQSSTSFPSAFLSLVACEQAISLEANMHKREELWDLECVICARAG